MTDVVAKNSKETVDQQTFMDGTTRMVAVLDSAVIGLGEYRPGQKWPEHARPKSGKNSEATPATSINLSR